MLFYNNSIFVSLILNIDIMLKKAFIATCFILFCFNVHSQISSREALIPDDLELVSGGVNISHSNLKVNNISATSVDFNGANNVNVSLQVDLETFDGNVDNILGNLFLYYKASNELSEVQIGFTTVTFTVTYPPFVSQTTYKSVNYFNTVTLNSSDFYALGGKIYAKYVNNNGNTYLSSNISVTGGTRPPVSNNSQNNVICCNQVVRRGDKPQDIVGSDAEDFYDSWGITSSPQANWLDADLNNLTNVASSSMNVLKFDYVFDSKIVKRRFYAPWSAIPSNMAPNKLISNQVDITVIPSPIISNSISSQAVRIDVDEYEINSGDTVDFTSFTTFAYPLLINDPFHVPNRRTDPVEEVTEFQWQYSGNSNNWTDILGAVNSTLNSFSPENYVNNRFKVRRIAKYHGISMVSNVLSFIVRDSNPSSNYICCDQSLTSDSSGIIPPQPLIGNTVIFSYEDANLDANLYQMITYNVTYRWQVQSRSTSWTDVNIYTKDYLPTDYPTTINSSKSYRRIAEISYSTNINNGSYTLYSSPVTIGVWSIRSKVSSNTDELENIDFGGKKEEITYLIYPNPTSSNINIRLKPNKSNLNARLYNNNGVLVKNIDFLNKRDGEVNFDISNLSKGMYILIINDETEIFKEKIIIE